MQDKPQITMKEKIENNFKYHAPSTNQINDYMLICNSAKEFAHLIDRRCPDSREKSLAITNLEQVVMWANAAIARNG